MNKVFDYNGTFVSASKPVKQLRTVKKTFMIDSADRDTVKYYTNGDFVIYLPRVYENVVSLRLMAAEFPLLVGVDTSSGNLTATNFAISGSTVTVTVSSTSQLYINKTIIIYGASDAQNNITTNIVSIPSSTTFTITNSSGVNAISQTATVTITPTSASPLPAAPAAPAASTHSYSAGQNIASSIWSASLPIVEADNVYYFLVDIEGLNKVDECAVAGNRSSFPDSYYAKIPVTLSNNGKFIEYNDHSGQDNISRYSPAIGKLDRMHIRTRLHSQQGNIGFIYWTTNGQKANGANHTGAEFSLTFEIEYLENVFDDFSSLETRIGERV